MTAHKPSPLSVPESDAVAIDLVFAIHEGSLDTLRRVLAERPEVASVRMVGRNGGWRTPLHTVADWPGYFPQGPASVDILLEAGADPNDDTGGDRPETPLHWAASTDDVDVALELINGGADIERPGGSIGTPLDNAIGYGCWHVARLLVAHGARVDALWHAAALGLADRTQELVAATPAPSQDDLNQAFWQACHGGQRRMAEFLYSVGADIRAVPHYANGQSALDVSISPDTRREGIASWLGTVANWDDPHLNSDE